MSSVLLLLAACQVEPAGDATEAGASPAAVRIAFSSRGEGEIEPCG